MSTAISTDGGVTSRRHGQPLRETVVDSLCLYLDQLNGHEPKNLYKIFMREIERPLLESVMQYCDGNQTKAARYLGLNRGTLRKKLKVHDLS